MDEATMIAALGSYARRELPIEALFRALVSHRDWIAPVYQLRDHLGWQKFDHIHVHSETFVYPPNLLWLFTGDQAVKRAVKQYPQLGPCATHLAGAEIFARVPLRLDAIMINPGSAYEESLCIEKKFLLAARSWGESARFEHRLEGTLPLSDDEKRQMLQNAPELIAILDAKSYALVTLQQAQGMANPTPVFTAADTLSRFFAALSLEELVSLRPIYLKGQDWVSRLPEQGIDGVIVNPFGGAPGMQVRV
jgi:hypothetical protein